MFIKLTILDSGNPVYVARDKVEAVYASKYDAGFVATYTYVEPPGIFVRETVEEVVALLGGI